MSTGCRACVLLLLNRVCTQQDEARHASKNQVHTPSCACRPEIVCVVGSKEENADATDRTAEDVTAEWFLKPCKAWCISCNVQLLLQVCWHFVSLVHVFTV